MWLSTLDGILVNHMAFPMMWNHLSTGRKFFNLQLTDGLLACLIHRSPGIRGITLPSAWYPISKSGSKYSLLSTSHWMYIDCATMMPDSSSILPPGNSTLHCLVSNIGLAWVYPISFLLVSLVFVMTWPLAILSPLGNRISTPRYLLP